MIHEEYIEVEDEDIIESIPDSRIETLVFERPKLELVLDDE